VGRTDGSAGTLRRFGGRTVVNWREIAGRLQEHLDIFLADLRVRPPTVLADAPLDGSAQAAPAREAANHLEAHGVGHHLPYVDLAGRLRCWA
jgi:hypothetical protein